MRWVFMLFLVLNGFYYMWHQQELMPRVKDLPSAAITNDDKQQIHLLSESATNAQDAVSLSACLFLGGYDQQSLAQSLKQRLNSLDINTQLQGVDTITGSDYWVYLAPSVSPAVALRQLKDLQSRKIDSYLIDRGELANGVSLGIYQRRDSADSVAQRLREVGYEPLVKELPRAQHYYWVRVAPQSRRLVDQSLVDRLTRDFSGLRQKIMPCESIATPE